MLNSLKQWNMLRLAKKSTKPSKDFVKKTEMLFLSEYKKYTKQKGYKNAQKIFPYFTKSIATAFVVLLLTTGTAAYADQKDVPTTNILYPLKRLSENARILLTKEAQKSQIHIEMADRRISEAKSIAENNKLETKRKLITEAKNDIKQSLEATREIEKESKKDQKKDNGVGGEKTKNDFKENSEITASPIKLLMVESNSNDNTQNSDEKSAKECKIFKKISRKNITEIDEIIKNDFELSKSFNELCDGFDE